MGGDRQRRYMREGYMREENMREEYAREENTREEVPLLVSWKYFFSTLFSNNKRFKEKIFGTMSKNNELKYSLAEINITFDQNMQNTHSNCDSV